MTAIEIELLKALKDLRDHVRFIYDTIPREHFIPNWPVLVAASKAIDKARADEMAKIKATVADKSRPAEIENR